MDDNDIILQILSNQEENLTEKHENNIDSNPLLENDNYEDESSNQNIDKSNIESTSEEKTTKYEKEFIPNIQNPINFVNYIEVDQSNTKISEACSNFVIQNHKKETKLKSVLDIQPHLDINSTIFSKEKKEILSIYIKDDIIILCDSLGNIIFYSLKEKKTTKNLLYPSKLFSLNNVNDSDKIINCLDMTDEHDILFVGYISGIINIFDLKKNVCKYSTSKIHNNTPIIELKYSHKEKNDFHILSCDIKGNVSYSILKDGVLGWRLVSTLKLIENREIPIFILKFIRPKEFINVIPSIENLNQTVIFGANDSIFIYSLEPNINQIECILKPEYINENCAPDIQIGVGKPLINQKYNMIDNTNNLIMAICWGNTITLYDLIIKDKFIIPPVIIGHYINNSPILKSGFLGNSVLYFIDENLKLNIINTRKMNFGNIQINPLTKRLKVPKSNSDAELLQETLLDRTILSQKKLPDINDENIKKDVYQYTIIENNSFLYILCKNALYYGGLVDWKEFLSKLSQKEDYLTMFSIGIDIYQGKMNALLNIPLDEENRKKVIGDFLRDEISKYVIFATGSKKSGAFDSSEDKKLIKDCMNLSIDLCLDIDSFDFLIKSLMPMFEAIEYGDYFLTKLEPFILYDRIKHVILSEDIINDIINIYINKKRKNTLSQLLLHINIKCIEKPKIQEKIKNLNLITVLIYLYMNGANEDYFEPINLMYQYFISSKELEGFINYNTSLEKYSLINILESKQYYGHKILWYIKLCLTERKFPNAEEKMDPKLYKELIPKIVYWLISEKVMNSFLSFDSKDYFSILQNIFSFEKYHKMLEESAKNQNMKIQTSAMLYNDKYQINDIEPVSLIEYVVNLCKDKNDKKIKLYAYIFVIHSSVINTIKKNMRLESINFILSNYDDIMKNENMGDISILIKNIINLLNDNYMFTDFEFESIYENINSDIFDEVSLFLLNKIKKYHKCLELFLKSNNKIESKKERIFKWISNVYQSLSYNEKGIREFKQDLKDKFSEIAEIDISKFEDMVKDIFIGEKKMILEKLSSQNKKVCLNYIEFLIPKFSRNLEKEEEIEFKNVDFVSSFLIQHIKLLCEFKKFDEVIKALENKDVVYPFKECLKLCEENKIYDAMIYLYKINGEANNGLERCLERINNNFQNFVNDINDNKIKEVEKDGKYIEINKKYLNMGIDVCEHNSESIDDNLWFKLLNKLYELENKLNEQIDINKNNDTNKKIIEHFQEQIIQERKDLIEKICSYVGITKILNIVSEKNKNADFKEFRELILKILFNYGSQTKIFMSARKLLLNLILENEAKFQIMNQDGFPLNLEKCDRCQKDFNDKKNKDSILVFKCKHLLHFKCSRKERRENGIELVCPICRELEIEDSIATAKSLIRRKSTKILNDVVDKKDVQINTSAKKANVIKKLKRFDNKLKNKKRLIIESNLKG